MENNWQRIWQNRNITDADGSLVNSNEILDHLLSIDGFDSGTGRILSPSWLSFTDKLMNNLEIEKGNSIFEVGCGAGAFLYPFFKKGNTVGGIDYSEKLIKHCSTFFRSDCFKTCDANNLESVPEYDFVFSFSVFFYFPDLAYAARVLELMTEKARKAVVVLDVPDLAKKTDCENLRRKQYPPGEYDKKYCGLNHLYYPKDWFREQSLKLKYSEIKIVDQNINGYFNNKFRFNCIMNK